MQEKHLHLCQNASLLWGLMRTGTQIPKLPVKLSTEWSEQVMQKKFQKKKPKKLMQSRKKASKVCTKTKSCWQKATCTTLRLEASWWRKTKTVFLFLRQTPTLFMPSSPLPHTIKGNENILKIVGMEKKKICNVKNAVSCSSRVLNHFTGRSIMLTYKVQDRNNSYQSAENGWPLLHTRIRAPRCSSFLNDCIWVQISVTTLGSRLFKFILQCDQNQT